MSIIVIHMLYNVIVIHNIIPKGLAGKGKV